MPDMIDDRIASQLGRAVSAAAGRPEVIAHVDRLYRALQTQVDQRRPVCVASGKCCHFERYGHRMYVSTMELAAFVAVAEQKGVPQNPDSGGSGCPFQIGKLCGVHGFRPFGCRVFYCDPTAKQWQQDQYEAFHAEIRMLHDEMEVPYFYVEWRAALAAVGLLSIRPKTF